MKTEARRLGDFGTQAMPSPKDRHAEYQRQCKELPKHRQAWFWRKAMEADPDVAALVGWKPQRGAKA